MARKPGVYINRHAVATGTAGDYILDVGESYTAYESGDTFSFQANADVVGPSTVNVNDLGALALVKPDGSQINIGDILSGDMVKCQYNGTDLRIISLNRFNVGSQVADQTYYVDVTSGSDTTGDGTSSSPWASIQHALDSIPKEIISGVTTTIKLGAGYYDEDVEVAGFTGNGTLVIEAEYYETGELATGGSTTTIVDTTKSWTTDQFAGGYMWITGYSGGTDACRGDARLVSSNTGTVLTTIDGMTSSCSSGNRYCVTAVRGKYFDILDNVANIKVAGIYFTTSPIDIAFNINRNETVKIEACISYNVTRTFKIISTKNVVLINCHTYSTVFIDCGVHGRCTTYYCTVYGGGTYPFGTIRSFGAGSTVSLNSYVSRSLTSGGVNCRAQINGVISINSTSTINRPTGGTGLWAGGNGVITTASSGITYDGTGTTSITAEGGQIVVW